MNFLLGESSVHDSNESFLVKKEIVNLELVMHRVKAIEQNLTNRANFLMGSVKAALEHNDNVRAINYAQEVAHIKKILKKIIYTEMILEIAKTRLEIISVLEPIREQIASVNALLAEARAVARNISPECSELDEINKQLENMLQIGSGVEQTSEISNILNLAASVAAKKIKEMYPEIPEDDKEINKAKLYEYIKSKNGKLVISEATKDLNMSREEIFLALEELKKEGKIVTEEYEKY